MLLAHWTYTPQEWKTFVNWTKKRRGLFYNLLHFFLPKEAQQTPEVRITPERVWIGDTHQHFSNDEYRFKKIDIRDEGGLNIMEISYERAGKKLHGSEEIRIPIPKGKLKEAIEVEMKLNQHIRGC